MEISTWSDVGFLYLCVMLGALIGGIAVVPITIALNELWYWRYCRRERQPHEWLVLGEILDWIRIRRQR